MKSWQVSVDTASIYASDLLIQGLIFLEMGDFFNARKYLDKEVELFKQLDEWLYLPTGLIGRARLFIKMEEFELAQNDLQEALEISQKTGAVFGLWETYLEFASLHAQKCEFLESKKFLEMAQKLPHMDLYKFRDVEITGLETRLMRNSKATETTSSS